MFLLPILSNKQNVYNRCINNALSNEHSYIFIMFTQLLIHLCKYDEGIVISEGHHRVVIRGAGCGETVVGGCSSGEDVVGGSSGEAVVMRQYWEAVVVRP